MLLLLGKLCRCVMTSMVGRFVRCRGVGGAAPRAHVVGLQGQERTKENIARLWSNGAVGRMGL